ncbi:amidase [Neolewinella antarctica]|uniref:Asp-tRNA(Asn)/Glu-tRNA(Gln) amidotransferase A subunit family amidase n=1 Tax=Neolewinella antarctica TaxID=442734 RepID=A0ABX0XAD8_9BACT|nr:amidase [Neolewinella antarctica]NJC26015.1 Asp-tRNA(Asn)/Glu-tRNA(Gln) amidotransferase A subunit family amidase [Neolewinella antarctica]
MRKLYLVLLAIAIFAGGMAVNELLTKSDLFTAAKVLGLDFLDDDEVELMLEDVQEQTETLEKLGKIEIDNDISPALVFNPVLRPSQLPASSIVSAPASAPNALESELNTPLEWASVKQLGAMLKSGKTTSRKLTEFYLDRIKEHDPTLHCIITITEERALAKADEMDRELAAGTYRGPLHGIPYGAKDLLAAKGYKTTWGAKPYENQTIDVDASVIEQLDAAGAILVAKTTLGALAWGDVWYGEMTRNPWDTTQGSSGSSAGSASAVAAGLVPFAIGTETLGSIVSPSTVCGTTGLRPTFGRVSRYGAMALSWTMDKIGPITRSAEDAGVVLAAIANYDERDAHAIRAGFQYEWPQAPAQGTRIGYYQSVMDGDYPFHDQDSIVLKTLRGLGYELVPLELPDDPDIGFILSVEAAAAFDALTRSNNDDQLTRQIRNAWPNTFRTAHFVPAVAYVQANRLRRQLMQDMDAMLTEANVDVYVNPSWHSNSLFITNMTGHPAICIPNGMNEEGTPTSITFTGKLFGEQEIIDVAHAYQQATKWDDIHPEAF